MMTTKEIAKKLRDVGAIEEHPYKKRAYFSASQTIENMLDISMEQIDWMEKTSGTGIGEGMAKKLRQMLQTGTFEKWEQNKSKFKINGNDVKKKKSGDIERIPYEFAYSKVKPIFDKIKPLCWQIELAGSLRRKKETIADADILVMCSESGWIDIRNIFIKETKLKASGPVKIEGDLDGFQIDITRALDSWGTQLLHFTGSKEHNIKLRQIAMNKGMSLSQHGICKGDLTVLRFNTEFEVFKFLGVDYVEPERR